MYLPDIFLQFLSHITCTLGNPFTHLGKNITPTCLYTREKMFLADLFDIYALKSISSRVYTYLGSIIWSWNHAMCLRWFLTCKLTWVFFIRTAPDTRLYTRLPCGNRGCCNKRCCASLHVNTKYRRHTACFYKHKIESKYVYIRLEMLLGTYISIKSIKMNICIFLSKGGLMDFPAWHDYGSESDQYTLCEFDSTTECTYKFLFFFASLSLSILIIELKIVVSIESGLILLR